MGSRGHIFYTVRQLTSHQLERQEVKTRFFEQPETNKNKSGSVFSFTYEHLTVTILGRMPGKLKELVFSWDKA